MHFTFCLCNFFSVFERQGPPTAFAVSIFTISSVTHGFLGTECYLAQIVTVKWFR